MTDPLPPDLVIKKEVDARGLMCPLPILRAKKALTDLQSGEVLKVIATDGGSVRDFQAFAKQTGNALLAQIETPASGDRPAEWAHLLRRR
ncbi:sulfurtransferase TusA family protein [Derxia gummosa]|uniref:Sulfurtransferase TusA family protein n=1 Tax=Derxia gummosa DSM 723 TaxID=1121388 RepID=A0A8B6X2X7_9BURK|nr:sulfurtransferase TusA family protein [Derxia gummosa]